MQKLWQIPLHCASSTPLTTVLSIVLLTNRWLVNMLALAQLGAQARDSRASIRTVINTTTSEGNSIIESV